MFDHISIGVRDVAKAKAFYDAALKPLGIDLPQRRRDIARLWQRGGALLGQCGGTAGCRRSQVRAPLLLHRAEPRERRGVPQGGDGAWRTRQWETGRAQGLWTDTTTRPSSMTPRATG